MGNKIKGSIVIVLALLFFFSTHEYAWIISSIFLGVGSGIFLWKE
jgi:hypothetical protein|tara:strand:- start:118 stop:252 length:135 start_codon:yes stop_codon:yes gene_type:complete